MFRANQDLAYREVRQGPFIRVAALSSSATDAIRAVCLGHRRRLKHNGGGRGGGALCLVGGVEEGGGLLAGVWLCPLGQVRRGEHLGSTVTRIDKR